MIKKTVQQGGREVETSMDGTLLLTAGLQLNPETTTQTSQLLPAANFSPIFQDSLDLRPKLFPQLHKAFITMNLLILITGSGIASLINSLTVSNCIYSLTSHFLPNAPQ